MTIEAFVKKHKDRPIDLTLLDEFKEEFGSRAKIDFVFEEDGQGNLTGKQTIIFSVGGQSYQVVR